MHVTPVRFCVISRRVAHELDVGAATDECLTHPGCQNLRFSAVTQ